MGGRCFCVTTRVFVRARLPAVP